MSSGAFKTFKPFKLLQTTRAPAAVRLLYLDINFKLKVRSASLARRAGKFGLFSLGMFPGPVIMLAVFGFNAIGNAIRVILGPRIWIKSVQEEPSKPASRRRSDHG